MAKKKELTIKEKMSKMQALAEKMDLEIKFDLTNLSFTEFDKLYQLWETTMINAINFKNFIELKNLYERKINKTSNQS